MSKRTRSDTGYTFFWRENTPNGWLSNWSPHGFYDKNGDFFPTAEHYFMHEKAMVMEDEDCARSILASDNPKLAKQLGKKVKNFDSKRWDACREDVVYNALVLKLRHHPLMHEKLLRTHNTVIAEASPYDQIWGIGRTENDPLACDEQSWPGLNLLGKAWMRLRHTLTKQLLRTALQEAEKELLHASSRTEVESRGYDKWKQDHRYYLEKVKKAAIREEAYAASRGAVVVLTDLLGLHETYKDVPTI